MGRYEDILRRNEQLIDNVYEMNEEITDLACENEELTIENEELFADNVEVHEQNTEMKKDIVKFYIDSGNIKSIDKCENPFDIISGREFFSNLSLWTQEEYGITISARQVIPYFHSSEVHKEVKDAIMNLISTK